MPIFRYGESALLERLAERKDRLTREKVEEVRFALACYVQDTEAPPTVKCCPDREMETHRKHILWILMETSKHALQLLSTRAEKEKEERWTNASTRA